MWITPFPDQKSYWHKGTGLDACNGKARSVKSYPQVIHRYFGRKTTLRKVVDNDLYIHPAIAQGA